MNVDQQIRTIMAETLEVDPATITDTFGPADSPLWDSLNALRMVSMFEEEFGIRLQMSEIATMNSFGAVKAAVRGHLEATQT